MKTTMPNAAQTPSAWEVDDLDELLDRVWSGFARGAYSNREPFHWPTIATRGEQAPALRTVVLRRSDRATRTLELHTDARSGKVAQLRLDPWMSWHFFDPDKHVQIRAQALAQLHERDAHARRTWEALSPSARVLYTSALAPGTPVEEPISGLPSVRESGPFAVPGADQGWANFVVITSQLQELDVLVLGRRGHRRARYQWVEADQRWQRSWVIP